jgi:hypothetical protein
MGTRTRAKTRRKTMRMMTTKTKKTRAKKMKRRRTPFLSRLQLRTLVRVLPQLQRTRRQKGGQSISVVRRRKKSLMRTISPKCLPATEHLVWFSVHKDHSGKRWTCTS